jgi:putative Ca2+/H+ antiporter (TMEM165/GDT1 family)
LITHSVLIIDGAALDWKLFVSTFTLIFIAELPDKTAFATLLMATRGGPWPIFVGACAAFFIQSLVAVTFGGAFSLLPEKWVHLGAGLLFIAFAWAALRRKSDDEDSEKFEGLARRDFWRVAWSSFLVIFIAEWGDLTQLATASLEAHYRNPLTIFTAATLALWTVTALAIIIGRHAQKVFHPVLLNRLAACAFIAVGGYFILSWARAS